MHLTPSWQNWLVSQQGLAKEACLLSLCFSPRQSRSEGMWESGASPCNLRQGVPALGLLNLESLRSIFPQLHLLLALGPWICDASALRFSFFICTMGRGIRSSTLYPRLHSPGNLDSRGLFYILRENTVGGKTCLNGLRLCRAFIPLKGNALTSHCGNFRRFD